MPGGRSASSFFTRLAEQTNALGGALNAHLHLDRAGTLDDSYFGNRFRVLENCHISLHEKHHRIHELHAGKAYEPSDLITRVERTLSIMTSQGVIRADTMVDTTDDQVGLTALQTLRELKAGWRDRIDLRLAAYSPFGFKDSEPGRWRVFEKAARTADFLGALPEADDRDEYPDHIGFDEHLTRMIDLARRRNMSLHVHVDQRNEASERGTERLIEAVNRNVGPKSADGAPMVWAVHMISPSTYDENRHRRLVDGLLDANIGVITCPSAAIGMRQLRAVNSPTFNSIPRILDLLAAGVHVRVGCDNIDDICSPSTTADLTDELFILSAALRFYNTQVLARLASGTLLSADERALVIEHQRQDQDEAARILNALSGTSV